MRAGPLISVLAPLSPLGVVSGDGVDFESTLLRDGSGRVVDGLGNDRMWSIPRLGADGH
jgi:hypothetical protein